MVGNVWDRRAFLGLLGGLGGLALFWPFRGWTKASVIEPIAEAAPWASWRNSFWSWEFGQEPRDAEGRLHVKLFEIPSICLQDVGLLPQDLFKNEDTVAKFASGLQSVLGGQIIQVSRPCNRDEIHVVVSDPHFDPIEHKALYPTEKLDKLTIKV